MWIHRTRRAHRPDEGAGEGASAGASAPAAAPAASPAPAPASAASADPPASSSPAASPAPAPGGEGATWRPDWREQLAGSDEAALKQLQRYASPQEVWKKAKALETRLSSGELRAALPAKPTPEQLNDWRKANGVPEKADGYDLGAASAKFGDETKAFLDRALPVLHAANLSNDQARTVLKFLNDNALDANAARAQSDLQAQEAGEEELRAEWGAEFKRNIGLIHGFLDKGADAEFKEAILDARDGKTGKPLSSDPRWLRMLLNAALIDNPAGKLVPGGGANPMKGVEDRIAEIESKMGTKAYINDDKMQSEYRELIDARDKLRARV